MTRYIHGHMETHSSVDVEKKWVVRQLGLLLDDSVTPVDHVARAEEPRNDRMIGSILHVSTAI